MAALSLLRLHVTPEGSNGILTVSAIGIAVRLSLRTRLTLIRLALISLSARGFPAPFIVTYTYICFSRRSRIPHGTLPDAPEYLTVRLRRRLECSPTDHINDPTASVDKYPIIIHARLLD